MRKMFSFMITSADGYHADPGQALDWQTIDQGKVLRQVPRQDLLIVQLSVLDDLLVAEVHNVMKRNGSEILCEQVHGGPS